MTDASLLFAPEPLAERGPTPLYMRLQERIRAAIANGDLKPSRRWGRERARP